MNQRSPAPARALAATALVCGFLVVIVLVATSLDGGGNGGGSGGRGSGHAARRGSGGGKRHTPKTYVVESGDTLTSIARKTGVSVARIVALNPGVDPQILVSGEKLKLR
jgi:LysM domain